MRYWAWFAAKIVVAVAVFYGLLGLLDPLAPTPQPPPGARPSNAVTLVNPNAPANPTPVSPKEPTEDERLTQRLAPFNRIGGDLAVNVGLMVWFLLAAGTFYMIVRDQRYRCRVCLRRLRMPVETGSRGFMLQLGRPRVEYICLYGHGTLKQEEYETSELENPQWTSSSGDMWEDLYAASRTDPDK
jgi:hypothetical protein